MSPLTTKPSKQASGKRPEEGRVMRSASGVSRQGQIKPADSRMLKVFSSANWALLGSVLKSPQMTDAATGLYASSIIAA